jgi:hypothetical protein
LATGAWVDATIGLWDTATGRRFGLLEPERKTGSVRQLFFSADGKMVVIGSLEGFVEFWDAATCRLQRSLSLNDARQPAQQHPNFHAFHLSPDERRLISLERVVVPKEGSQVCIWETQPAKLVASHEVARAPRYGWAPLGNQAAVLTDDGIAVADGTTGMIHPRVPGTWDPPLAASPDARLLAARLKQALRPPERSEQQREAEGIRVWEAATGKEVVTLPTGPVDFLSLTPDTRKIITVDGRSLRIWDLATGKELHRRDFPEEFAASFQFVRGLYLSPDGRRATTALADGTLLVWEIPAVSRALAVDTKGPDAQEATSWWSELASADAAKAYAAVWKLIDARERSVAVLRQNLTPAVADDFRKAEQLLRDLDSDVFSVRQAAAKELEKMGSAVAPVLRQVLAANPSPEVRRRLETLLEKCSRGIPSAEVLRRLRCVLVLERIGSPEARQVLQSMAGGAPAALETQEARTALERLAEPAK